MKFFVIFVVKKKWQVSVARNKILFHATDTCQLFFNRKYSQHLTFFHIFNISFENCKFNFLSLVSKEQVLIATECLVNTAKSYQLHF